MTAYTAKFSNGSEFSLKNSRREYAAAWAWAAEWNGAVKGGHGFSRTRELAERAVASEIAQQRKYCSGIRLIFSEVVEVEGRPA